MKSRLNGGFFFFSCSIVCSVFLFLADGFDHSQLMMLEIILLACALMELVVWSVVELVCTPL
jgi:hypothetical protein